MKKTVYKSIKTPEGITIHLVIEPGENPKPHNLTGPAMIYPDGREEYYINGLKMTQTQFNGLTKKRPAKSEEEEG